MVSAAAEMRGGTGGGATTCGVGSRSNSARAGAPGAENSPCASSAPGRPDNVIHGLPGATRNSDACNWEYGAEQDSNNVAEISALIRGMERVMSRWGAPEGIGSDSDYALGVGPGSRGPSACRPSREPPSRYD